MRPFSRSNFGTPGVPTVYRAARPDRTFSDELAARLCREYTQECVETLVKHMRNDGAPGISLAATTAILDRGFGKPKEIKTLAGPDGKQPRIKVDIQFVDSTIAPPGDNTVIDQAPQPVFED